MTSDNSDPIITADGKIFLNTSFMPATRARCLYLGKTTLQRLKWLRDYPDNWRPLPVVGQTASRECSEHAVALPAAPLPMLLNDTERNSGTVSSLPQTELRAPEDEQPAPAMLPVVADPQAQSTRDEIIIAGRRLVSEQQVAAMLGVCRRTLQRWGKRKFGPPRIKLGRKIFYDRDELTDWIKEQ